MYSAHKYKKEFEEGKNELLQSWKVTALGA